jgi:hypothetical protein
VPAPTHQLRLAMCLQQTPHIQNLCKAHRKPCSVRQDTRMRSVSLKLIACGSVVTFQSLKVSCP